LTRFSMKAATAVAPYALTFSSLVPAALPHRGLNEALNQQEPNITSSGSATVLGWPLGESFATGVSDVEVAWFSHSAINYDFAVSEEAFGEVEVLTDVLIEDDTPIIHSISDPDLAAIEIL